MCQRCCVRLANSTERCSPGVGAWAYLILIFINDLNFGIKSWILKFADDTKIFNHIKPLVYVTTLQEDLHRLIRWAEEWQMLFNVDKCKVGLLHVGNSDLCRQYFMHGQKLDKVSQERGLGVIISNDLKVCQQRRYAYRKASKILGLINRAIEYRHTDILLRLYQSQVRPQVEYCVVAWSPYYKKMSHWTKRYKRGSLQ